MTGITHSWERGEGGEKEERGEGEKGRRGEGEKGKEKGDIT